MSCAYLICTIVVCTVFFRGGECNVSSWGRLQVELHESQAIHVETPPIRKWHRVPYNARFKSVASFSVIHLVESVQVRHMTAPRHPVTSFISKNINAPTRSKTTLDNDLAGREQMFNDGTRYCPRLVFWGKLSMVTKDFAPLNLLTKSQWRSRSSL